MGAKGSDGHVGGMPVPEAMLGDNFFTARLKLVFFDGEDGELVITIEKEVLDVVNGMWNQCMNVKIFGRTIPISVLNKRLREIWKPSGEMFVMDLPRQFFMVRFEVEDEYLAALTGGP